MNGGSSTIEAYDISKERIEEMPVTFRAVSSSSGRSDEESLTGSIEKGDRKRAFPLKPSKFPLFQLKVAGRTLFPSKPISVQITQDGEWFFAENEALRVAGVGSSFEEAVLDMEQHIVHFWEYYNSLQSNKVIGEAVRLKGVYSNLLTELG